jgi:hypothetical protein
MLPDAHISHLTSQRMRIKIPSKKGDTSYFSYLKGQFSKYQGIERLEVNAMTGSVLFVHNLNEKEIARYARNNNIFILKRTNNSSSKINVNITESFKDIDKKVRGITGGEMDMGTLAFLALLGTGIYQIGRGNFMAIPWYTAFWYALNIFLKSQSGKGKEGE